MSVHRHSALCFMAAATMGLFATSARADFVPGASIVDPGLAGSADSDAWTNASLTTGANPGFGGFPGLGAWPGPIPSAVGGDVGLYKLSDGAVAGAYPGGGSIYFGGFTADPNTQAATLAVQESTPVSNLANVVFQVQIGEAFGYDFFNHALPVLSYNGGAQDLAATVSLVTDKVQDGTFSSPVGEEPVYVNTYMLQWDLSGIAGINDFSISFTGVEHAQVYALRLDQSDVYQPYAATAAVPEPGSLVLLGCGIAALFVKVRKPA